MDGTFDEDNIPPFTTAISQSVSQLFHSFKSQPRTEHTREPDQLFHGPAPRSPLHRLSVRFRQSRSNTSTEYSLPGAIQLDRK